MTTARSDNPKTIKCRECGAVNTIDRLRCTTCNSILRPGTGLLGVASLAELESKFGGKTLPHRLFLNVLDMDKMIIVELEDSVEHIIGRRDPVTGEKPSIDLASYQAGQKGVSRRHARLRIDGKKMYLSDLRSANHTYVNNKQLPPDTEVLVHEGDEMRFGLMRVLIAFYDETW